MYSETTKGIAISVEPFFLEDQSEPENAHFVWAYRVTIENNSSNIVQLINREWKITNAYGFLTEVQGKGVVGEQPKLRPGDSFQYESGTPLDTSSGIMTGKYEMQDGDGTFFDVTIPAFSLDSPYSHQAVN